MQKNSEKTRCNLRLSAALVDQIDMWAKANSVSRTSAIESLLSLGMDANKSGVESLMAMDESIKKQMNWMRKLCIDSIEAADTSAVLSAILSAKSGVVQPSEIADLYRQARSMLPKLQAMKNKQ